MSELHPVGNADMLSDIQSDETSNVHANHGPNRVPDERTHAQENVRAHQGPDDKKSDNEGTHRRACYSGSDTTDTANEYDSSNFNSYIKSDTITDPTSDANADGRSDETTNPTPNVHRLSDALPNVRSDDVANACDATPHDMQNQVSDKRPDSSACAAVQS